MNFNSLFFYVVESLKKLKMFFMTFWCRIKMVLWGVTYGKNSWFYGNTLFQRVPGSHISIGKNCEFRSSQDSNQIGVYTPCSISTLQKNAQIIIGDNCGMTGCVIGCSKSISIGNNVRIGANVLITDTDWHTSDKRTMPDKDVVIGNNVWLGYGVKVLKGVTIGDNCVIGLGSIVTHDIPANTIAAGNPCKVIKMI